MAAGTPESFRLDMTKWAAETKEKLDQFVSEVVGDIAEDIIRNTPVDTGFLRASWYANLNQLPVFPLSAGDIKAAVGEGFKQALGIAAGASIDPMTVAATMKAGDQFFLSNGANYAVHVEYGTVHMAPRAMVRSVVARADAYMAAAAARLGLA